MKLADNTPDAPKLFRGIENFGRCATVICRNDREAKPLKPERRAVVPPGGRLTMKKILTIFAMTGSILLMSACNTVEGAGKDVESVGDCADGVKGNC